MLDPTHDRRVRQGESTFGHHLHEITKAEFVAQIPAHAEDDYFAIEMAAFEEFVHVEHSSALSFEQSAGKLCRVNPVRTRAVLNESIVVEGQDRVLTVPWTRASSRRGREIIQGVGEPQRPLRAMRTKARDGFVRALGDARRWLNELLIDPAQTIESLAMREHKSERSIRMTVSLAFVSPVLAEAAMEGRLPRGFSVKRLIDLPMLWSDQWSAVGLREPIQVRAELG